MAVPLKFYAPSHPDADANGMITLSIVPPASSTDNAIVRYNGTGGDVLQDSATLISDTGGLTTASAILNGPYASLEVGPMAVTWNPFIDFHSSGTGCDYDARIIVDSGSSTSAQGNMDLQAGVLKLNSIPMYACRGWVNFNGTGTPAIRTAMGITGITDNGTGDYTVNFSFNYPDANYVVVGKASNMGVNGFAAVTDWAVSVGGYRCILRATNNGNPGDQDTVELAFFR